MPPQKVSGIRAKGGGPIRQVGRGSTPPDPSLLSSPVELVDENGKPIRQHRAGRPSMASQIGYGIEPGDVDLAKRRAYALNMRHMGYSYQAIAEHISQVIDNPRYSKDDAYVDVRSGVESVVRAPARELVEDELSRIDALIRGLWDDARGGTEAGKRRVDPKVQHNAIDRVIRLMERRARYLGLDSPIKQVVTGPDDGPIQLEAVTADPAKLASAAAKTIEAMLAERGPTRYVQVRPGDPVEQQRPAVAGDG